MEIKAHLLRITQMLIEGIFEKIKHVLISKKKIQNFEEKNYSNRKKK